MLTLEDTTKLIAEIEDLIKHSPTGKCNIVIADMGNERFVNSLENTIFIDPEDTEIKQTDAKSKNFKYIKAEFDKFFSIANNKLGELIKGKVDKIFIDYGNGGHVVVSSDKLKIFGRDFLSKKGKIFINANHLSSYFSKDDRLCEMFTIAFPKNATRYNLDWVKGNYQYENLREMKELCIPYVSQEYQSAKGQRQSQFILDKWGISEDEEEKWLENKEDPISVINEIIERVKALDAMYQYEKMCNQQIDSLEKYKLFKVEYEEFLCKDATDSNEKALEQEFEEYKTFKTEFEEYMGKFGARQQQKIIRSLMVDSLKKNGMFEKFFEIFKKYCPNADTRSEERFLSNLIDNSHGAWPLIDGGIGGDVRVVELTAKK
ncbi:MAG: hypothetical protein K6C34_00350 [Alphaproteobacteria bacterium]|nr:hypothetical protein [Alphaproteobacteria bacterium]